MRREQERGLERESIRQALIEGEQSGEPERFDIAAFKRRKAGRHAEYRLSPRAQRDLDAIFDHIVAHGGLSQAMRYTDLIEAACVDLADAPQQAQGCADIRPGYRRRGVERHVIYFRPTSYGIAVIRILHQRMDTVRHL